MNEAEALAWLADAGVSRETLARLEAYRAAVIIENSSQNLVGRASIEEFWARHIVDSAQLMTVAREARSWLDIGSGAGLPGIVIAIITGAPVTLVEPRKRRAEFLERLCDDLALSKCEVATEPIARVATRPFDAITARAVAPLPELLEMGRRFSHDGTIWVLPKGRSAHEELAALPKPWQGGYVMQPSVTDPESQIIVGRGCPTRAKR